MIRSVTFIGNSYSDSFLNLLLERLESVQCEPGQVIIQDKCENDKIYFIMSGIVRLEIGTTTLDASYQPLILKRYNKLDVFGKWREVGW